MNGKSQSPPREREDLDFGRCDTSSDERALLAMRTLLLQELAPVLVGSEQGKESYVQAIAVAIEAYTFSRWNMDHLRGPRKIENKKLLRRMSKLAKQLKSDLENYDFDFRHCPLYAVVDREIVNHDDPRGFECSVSVIGRFGDELQIWSEIFDAAARETGKAGHPTSEPEIQLLTTVGHKALEMGVVENLSVSTSSKYHFLAKSVLSAAGYCRSDYRRLMLEARRRILDRRRTIGTNSDPLRA